MKKLYAALLAGLLALLMLSTAAAEGSYIRDDTGLLTPEQFAALDQAAGEIAGETGCGVYILLTDEPASYCNTDDMGRAAGVVYANYQLGEGPEKSGILLLVDTQGRRYGLYAYGYGSTAFTDYGKEALSFSFRSYFSAENWYQGLTGYLNESRRMIQLARDGSPMDVGEPVSRPIQPEERMMGVLFCMLLGLIVAFLVRGHLKRQLRSVAYAHNANNFVADGAVALTEHYDHYSHTTTSRDYDPPDRDSERGGTTTDSRGGSSSSGSF